MCENMTVYAIEGMHKGEFIWFQHENKWKKKISF